MITPALGLLYDLLEEATKPLSEYCFPPPDSHSRPAIFNACLSSMWPLYLVYLAELYGRPPTRLENGGIIEAQMLSTGEWDVHNSTEQSA